MRVLHGKEKFDSSRAACKNKKKRTLRAVRRRKICVEVGGRWYKRDFEQEKIKQQRSIARSNMRKRPATCGPSNMESLADWLQKRDYPSQRGKTKEETRLGKFVKAQRKAYLGNRPPYLTIHDIRKLEELPGWTFPLPSFGEMLGKVEGPSLAKPAPSHDSAVPDAPKEH